MLDLLYPNDPIPYYEAAWMLSGLWLLLIPGVFILALVSAAWGDRAVGGEW